jgi:hypothetical protein
MRLIISALILYFLGACTLLPSKDLAPPVLPGIGSGLMLWVEPEREVEAVQLLTGHGAGKNFTFQVRISVTKERMLLVAVNPFGQRVMTIAWDDKGISSEHSEFLRLAIIPEQIIFNILLAYWPKERLRVLLNDSLDVFDDKEGVRRVTLDGEDVVIVEYASDRKSAWSEKLNFKHILYDYQLAILSHEVSRE